MLTDGMAEVVATTEGLAEVARSQFRAVLESVESPAGVAAALRQRLLDGRVLGETYWRDGCGCVLGTIAYFDGADAPAEEALGRCAATVYALEDWAHPIALGDFPDHTAPEDTGAFRAAVLVSWIDQFEAERP